MRRPLSIQRVNATEGWIEILYKIVGPGLRALSRAPRRRRHQRAGPHRPAVSARSEAAARAAGRRRRGHSAHGVPRGMDVARKAARGSRWCSWARRFRFRSSARPSTILVPGIPAGSIAAMPLLDGWGVPSRLASKAGFAGCYDGFVTQLADEWLGSLDAAAKAEVEVFSCGPTPMLEAMAKVAAKHDVPCQVSLEEFMACAVGGCAGCTVTREDARWPGDETRVRGRAGVRFARGLRLEVARGAPRRPPHWNPARADLVRRPRGGHRTAHVHSRATARRPCRARRGAARHAAGPRALHGSEEGHGGAARTRAANRQDPAAIATRPGACLPR